MSKLYLKEPGTIPELHEVTPRYIAAILRTTFLYNFNTLLKKGFNFEERHKSPKHFFISNLSLHHKILKLN